MIEHVNNYITIMVIPFHMKNAFKYRYVKL